jgi:hypothetical protein
MTSDLQAWRGAPTRHDRDVLAQRLAERAEARFEHLHSACARLQDLLLHWVALGLFADLPARQEAVDRIDRNLQRCAVLINIAGSTIMPRMRRAV